MPKKCAHELELAHIRHQDLSRVDDEGLVVGHLDAVGQTQHGDDDLGCHDQHEPEKGRSLHFEPFRTAAKQDDLPDTLGLEDQLDLSRM